MINKNVRREKKGVVKEHELVLIDKKEADREFENNHMRKVTENPEY